MEEEAEALQPEGPTSALLGNKWPMYQNSYRVALAELEQEVAVMNEAVIRGYHILKQE